MMLLYHHNISDILADVPKVNNVTWFAQLLLISIK